MDNTDCSQEVFFYIMRPPPGHFTELLSDSFVSIWYFLDLVDAQMFLTVGGTASAWVYIMKVAPECLWTLNKHFYCIPCYVECELAGFSYT